jgi:hypothetical protein
MIHMKIPFVGGLIFCQLLLSSGAYAQSATQFVTIRRHSSLSMSNAQADKILRDASVVLQVDDDFAVGTGDIACDVTLSRVQDVRNFATSAPASVNSSADYVAVSAEDSFVKVVDTITFCGGRFGTFAGCTTTPGRNMVVEETGANRDIVWAHEFGHATGLQHRNAPKALMTSVPLASDQRYVNQTECDSFKAGPPVSALSSEPMAKAEEKSASPASDGISLPELARTSFTHNVPYALIAAARPAELPAVIEMLYDLREQDHWANVAIIIGVLGDRQSVTTLDTFLRDPLVGSSPSASLRAKVAALIGLGYLANRLPDSAAIAALLSRVDSSAWDNAGRWMGQTQGIKAGRTKNLREVTLIGLALSGHADALPALTDATTQAMAAGGSDRDKQFNSELSATYERVKQVGLPGYYGE